VNLSRELPSKLRIGLNSGDVYDGELCLSLEAGDFRTCHSHAIAGGQNHASNGHELIRAEANILQRKGSARLLHAQTVTLVEEHRATIADSYEPVQRQGLRFRFLW
jgi:hypothetical protein